MAKTSGSSVKTRGTKMTTALLDETMLIYVLVLAVSLYGAGLFLWWWSKKGKATNIYIYVTFIFVGEVIETAVVMWSRFLVLTGQASAKEIFQGSAFWSLRKVVLLIALSLIVVRMTQRRFCNEEGENDKLPK
jgi:hypothetical protein